MVVVVKYDVLLKFNFYFSLVWCNVLSKDFYVEWWYKLKIKGGIWEVFVCVLNFSIRNLKFGI